MKKVLIASDIHALLKQDGAFLNRTDIQVFVAATNDDILKIHREERMDLIITRLDMPGLEGERLYQQLREDAALRSVSLIMTCANTPEEIRKSSRIRSNAVLLQPLHPVLLMAKAQQLLDIAARQTFRVLLSANIDGHSWEGSFYCRTRNISTTGMLIETNRRLADESRLSCQFYLPQSKRIQASGKIVRIIEQSPGNEEYHYGFMFTDISAEARQALADFVERAARR